MDASCFVLRYGVLDALEAFTIAVQDFRLVSLDCALDLDLERLTFDLGLLAVSGLLVGRRRAAAGVLVDELVAHLAEIVV